MDCYFWMYYYFNSIRKLISLRLDVQTFSNIKAVDVH